MSLDSPDTIYVVDMSDELFLMLLEKVGSSGVCLVMSKRQLDLVNEKMVQKKNGSWIRKDG